MAHEIEIVAAVLSLIRGETAAACIAHSFGVTEAQVENWKDIFQVAGVVALTNAVKSGRIHGDYLTDDGEPTTTPHPKKPRLGGEPTTKPPKPLISGSTAGQTRSKR